MVDIVIRRSPELFQDDLLRILKDNFPQYDVYKSQVNKFIYIKKSFFVASVVRIIKKENKQFLAVRGDPPFSGRVLTIFLPVIGWFLPIGFSNKFAKEIAPTIENIANQKFR
jgi:hypothetical protein